MMKRVLSKSQAHYLDKVTTKDFSIQGKKLMGNAGQEVADIVRGQLQEEKIKSVLIICGKGNNGGDGISTALKLKDKLIDVHIHLLFEKEKIMTKIHSLITISFLFFSFDVKAFDPSKLGDVLNEGVNILKKLEDSDDTFQKKSQKEPIPPSQNNSYDHEKEMQAIHKARSTKEYIAYLTNNRIPSRILVFQLHLLI